MEKLNQSGHDSQILTAIKEASSSELVALLFRFGLADVFLKCLKERELVFSDESLPSPIQIQSDALSQFKSANNLETAEDVSTWCFTRGMKEDDMVKIANWMKQALVNHDKSDVLSTLRSEVKEFCNTFPLPSD